MKNTSYYTFFAPYYTTHAAPLYIAGCAVVVVAALLAATMYYQPSAHTEQERENGNAENLYAYNDYFFEPRNYPQSHPDLSTYTQAMRQAQMQARQASSRSAVGFDGEWLPQGATNIGGRINCVTVDPTNDAVIYLGTARGGIFKTTNGGGTWLPIFDEQTYLSIGCITLDPTNSQVVYAGTGDPNISGYPGIGNGVYKSTDGGATWQHKGLAAQSIVSAICIDSANPNTVYAATMGLPFVRNNQRGVYKSTDGGDTWQQALLVGDSAGVIDMLIHPTQPNVLYASSWNRIRNNTESLIQGTDAHIYKSTDNGNTWNILANGLPEGEIMSRINITLSHGNPSVLYAAYVSPDNFQVYNVYKSTNDGEAWQTLPTADFLSSATGGQGWYYTKIVADPNNAEHAFLLALQSYETTDGGNTWSVSCDWCHADCHDLTFNSSSSRTYLATDGGAYQRNNNSAWTDLENLPNTQFYRTEYNPHSPQWYYGGAQDNGTIFGNATIANNWNTLYGADGFQMRFDPTQPNRSYLEYQNGAIVCSIDGGDSYVDGSVGIEADDRRSWDMPYIISPHNPDVLYTITHRMYQSNSADYPNWSPISPSLSDEPVFANRFHVGTALDESPLTAGLLYAGTSDANVWVSTNGGANWDSIHQHGLANRYVSAIKASQHQANTVYVAQTGYKDNDFSPHLFKSTDAGATFVSIAGNLPNVSVNTLYEMPQSPQILFVGTDAGVYGTTDGGISWQRLGSNLPIVPVYDLSYNPAQGTLVAATFARAIQTYDVQPIIAQQVGINPANHTDQRVRFAPQPASLYTYLVLPDEQQAYDAVIQLFDAQGKCVLTHTTHPQQRQVPLHSLSAGCYVATVQVQGNTTAHKMLKLP